jgi:ATP-binding cassette, subfamily B, bacterial PglK
MLIRMIRWAGGVWGLLTDKLRGQARRLLIWMILGSVLEVFSIGIVLPVVSVLVKDDSSSRILDLFHVLKEVEMLGPYSVVIGALLVMCVAYAFKAVFLLFLANKQAWFIYDIEQSIGGRLFSRYLQMPMSDHLARNSSELIRNVDNESAFFANSAIAPLLLLITEVSVVVGVLGLLFVVDPVAVSTVLCVFIPVGGLYLFYVKNRVYTWGQDRLEHKAGKIKALQQGLGGIVETKLLGHEEFFFNKFLMHQRASAIPLRKMFVFGRIPTIGLEFLAVLSFVSIIIVMVLQESEKALAVIALFGAAAFRILPSIARVLVNVQSLRFAASSSELLCAELAGGEAMSNKSGNIEPIRLHSEVLVRGVSYRYRSGAEDALKSVNLRIGKGVVFGLVGRSGSGKSTLVNLLLGLLEPTAGDILVDGASIKNNLRGWQSQVGYVPQTIFLTDDTLRNNVAFGVRPREIDEKRLRTAIADSQLSDLVAKLPKGLDTVLGERGNRLSGGERQRIGIARALYCRPQLLVLDEATNALDVQTEAEIVKIMLDLKGSITVVIVSHRQSTLTRCTRIARLERGVLEVD